VHSPADNIFLPSRVPIHSNNEVRPKKQKLLAQISYPNQFATAIVTSAGALIAALKAREVEKVSLGCPFNRIG
jgi:maleate cis-trans isomerase